MIKIFYGNIKKVIYTRFDLLKFNSDERKFIEKNYLYFNKKNQIEKVERFEIDNTLYSTEYLQYNSQNKVIEKKQIDKYGDIYLSKFEFDGNSKLQQTKKFYKKLNNLEETEKNYYEGDLLIYRELYNYEDNLVSKSFYLNEYKNNLRYLKLTSIFYPSMEESCEEYYYDKNNCLILQILNSCSYEYKYDSLNRKLREQFKRFEKVEWRKDYKYDINSNVIEIIHKDYLEGNDRIEEFQYKYDLNENIIRINFIRNGITIETTIYEIQYSTGSTLSRLRTWWN